MNAPATFAAPYDVDAIRRDFPILSRTVYGKPLVYLDNGASAQKPKAVIDTIAHAYTDEYANVHRGLHFLSNAATEKYEEAREIVRGFLNAAHAEEIIFTRNATASFGSFIAFARPSAVPVPSVRNSFITRSPLLKSSASPTPIWKLSVGWAISEAKPRAELSSCSIFFSNSSGLRPSKLVGSVAAILSEVASCCGVIGLRRATANVFADGRFSESYWLLRE